MLDKEVKEKCGCVEEYKSQLMVCCEIIEGYEHKVKELKEKIRKLGEEV